MRLLVEADVVEDEKLGFRAEKGGVSQLGAQQVGLGALGDAAGVAEIGLARDGVFDRADQRQGGGGHERVHDRGGRIGHDEHVGFVDFLPAANGRSVEAEAVFEHVGFEIGDGHGEVLPSAGQIDELEIDHLRVVLAC